METTVDAAIRKGRWLLFWMPVLILLGGVGLFSCIFLGLMAGDIIWVNVVVTVVTLIVPPVLSIIYYLLMLPRWRIWAFSNVRNVHELKSCAVLAQFYPKDGSFLWRLEIVSAGQKQQIEEIAYKFGKPDVFIDDPDIPFETVYSYSPVLSFAYLLFTLVSIAVTITFIAEAEWLIAGILFASGIFISSMTYKRYRLHGKPLLVISNEGISTIDKGFYAWKDIANEKVYYVSAGNASHYGVSFEAHGEKIAMSMKEITGLSSYRIDHVLRTYRGRYETYIKTGSR